MKKASAVRLLSVMLCLVLAISVVIFTRTEIHAAAGCLMYFNDRAWPRSGSQPLEKIYSTLYVPITLFAQLNDVSVLKNEGMQTFIIKHGDYSLSFNYESDFAYTQDLKQMYWRTAYYHGEYYVPVRSVCSYLHIDLEEMTSPVTGEIAIRLTDGSQKKTFKELILEKYPAFFPEETTSETETSADSSTVTDPPVTIPDTDTTEPVRRLEERTIYITIEDSPGKYTADILEVLEDYDRTATFFVIGDNALKSPAMLSQIAAQGHAIGLHTMHHNAAALTDAEAILADIEEENLLLSRLIKQKSHIWRAPDGSEKLLALQAGAALTLRHEGYVIWDYNVNVPTNARTAKAAADTAIKGIWDNEVVILRFAEDDSTAEVLRLVLDFIEENAEVCDVRTISPAYYEFSRAG